jgi:RNA polymerase sigma factor (sigma-70 family)
MDEPEARETATTAASSPAPSAGPDLPPDPAAHDAEFAAFYRGFLPRLVAFLRWQGVPLVEAVDIAQETMTRAYQRWTMIEYPQAWARRVASRMWARRLADTVEDLVAEVTEQPSLLTVTDITAWEQRHDVLRLLDRLPPRQRQVLAWTLDGYTPTEIGTELNMTAEAVRASLAKARRTLAAYLHATEEQR